MKQCKEFYEALERGNSLMAHLLFMPEPQIAPHILEYRIRYKALKDKLDYEMERLESMSPEMIRFEIELGFKDK